MSQVDTARLTFESVAGDFDPLMANLEGVRRTIPALMAQINDAAGEYTAAHEVVAYMEAASAAIENATSNLEAAKSRAQQGAAQLGGF
jgi:hypothetical protein